MSALTVKEMAERLGLVNHGGWWRAGGTFVVYPMDGAWKAHDTTRSIFSVSMHPTEHEAMLYLYLRRFPEAETTAEATPAPVKRTNVAVVLAAWEVWKRQEGTPQELCSHVDAEFGRMLAEAFVQDEVERGQTPPDVSRPRIERDA